MTVLEFAGVFYAVYGVCWLVFALTPLHEIRERKENSIERGVQHTEAANQQEAPSARKKLAA